MAVPGPAASLPSLAVVALGSIALALVPGCGDAPPATSQGYVEGEFVYVAAPHAGALKALSVQRGAQVEAGAALFAVDSAAEAAAVDEATQRLAQARAQLADAGTGLRQPELEAIEAQLAQARSALALRQGELARQEELAHTPAAIAAQELDRARAARDQARARVAQLEAELATGRLGARSAQVAAAAANVAALEAALARAAWDLAQQRQAAPQAGLVFDTLYREGEWVAAGRPVVALLPPRNRKVRTFVREAQAAAIHPGDPVSVAIDGLGAPLAGTVGFVSPQAEFTPPVIYSRESRDKLVFMVEIGFPPEVAAGLHPGQPVDVRFAR